MFANNNTATRQALRLGGKKLTYIGLTLWEMSQEDNQLKKLHFLLDAGIKLHFFKGNKFFVCLFMYGTITYCLPLIDNVKQILQGILCIICYFYIFLSLPILFYIE